MLTVDQRQARRFRLARHHLLKPARRSALLTVAGATGIQHTPPGSAAQSLHVRLDGLTPEHVTAALAEDKTLVQVWSLRGAPHVVGVQDAAVFTTGLLPDDEDSCLAFIPGVQRHLAAFGLTAGAAVEHTREALPQVLDGRQLTKDELGVALAEHVAVRVPGVRKGPWEEPDGLGHNTYGQSLVRFALYVAGLYGTVCFVPTRQGAARFALTEQWLGTPLPRWDAARARAELLRRYLRCHGPSTAREFAAWTGVSTAYASRSWELLAGELAEVRYRDAPAWALDADVDLLRDPPEAVGVRLLPPYDPYLANQDRACLLADPALRRKVWRTTSNPGVVLVDGDVAGLWRPRKQGRRLTLLVEAFARLSAGTKAAIRDAAAELAPFRGAETVMVEF
ncbi:winged helix DNA-binding domain-containing protein [Streptomyces halobius]|uniref:Winged helix DNA-binding domain-containing protein n=1 Tax=Streptomyces halobius TaxID=2879846 RepID=A0ABY4M2Q0_9ACTN|nr:winged helix DNA-binding domain-containing protein [Streptomyces halobius]UQA91995.1 winged helix DNA-binding domain-containing protein [Streptomyces halobius]